MGTIMTKNANSKTSITTDEYREANFALPRIEKLIYALKDINRRVVSNDAQAFAEIKDFEAKIITVYKKYQGIVETGRELFEARDKELLNKANLRIVEIPGAINQLESSFEHRLRAHAQKSNELKKQDISQDDIDRICKPVPEAEYKELASKIQSLRDEEKALFEFVNDGPCFDVELLKNTAVYPESTKII